MKTLPAFLFLILFFSCGDPDEGPVVYPDLLKRTWPMSTVELDYVQSQLTIPGDISGTLTLGNGTYSFVADIGFTSPLPEIILENTSITFDESGTYEITNDEGVTIGTDIYSYEGTLVFTPDGGSSWNAPFWYTNQFGGGDFLELGPISNLDGPYTIESRP